MDSVDTDTPSVSLKQGIKLNDLINGDGVTFEVNFDDENNEQYEKNMRYNSADALKFANAACIGINDEDEYTDGEPFETLAAKMVDLMPSGDVKKRIIREGYGELPPEDSTVYIDYNAYLEYNDEPYDSTYIRKKPHIFKLNSGEVIVGLNIGVKTMRISEKAQFLIKPDVAYGPLGCLNRIPSNATILYEVELKKYVNAGASITYEKLSETQQKDFAEIYKYCLALCEKGNNLFTTYKNYKAATYEYNVAVGKLEYCQLADYDEQEQQQGLLLRLYTNLAVCHMKMNEPKRTCLNCNKIHSMVRGTRMIVPLKVYYNNVKALIALNDLDSAEKRLRWAATRHRDTPEFVKLYIEINKGKEDRKKRDTAFAKGLLKSCTDKSDDTMITEDFKKCVTDLCIDLKNQDNIVQLKLPEKLNEVEIDFAKAEAKKHELYFAVDTKNKVFYISKLKDESASV